MENILEQPNGVLIKTWIFLERNANMSLKSTFGLGVANANQKKQEFWKCWSENADASEKIN